MSGTDGSEGNERGDSEVPPVPPLVNVNDGDITVPNSGVQSDQTLAGPAVDPTLAMPVTAAGAGSGGVIPPHGQQSLARDDSSGGRPAWLVPFAGGLVATLVVALGAVAIFGGDDDTTDELVAVDSTVVGEDVAADATVVADAAAPAATAPTVAPAETTAPDTTAAPDSTAVPDTAAPDTAAPDTAAEPAPAPTDPAITPATDAILEASDGFVRVENEEFPILRRCQSNPFQGFGVTSFVFDDGSGFLTAVDLSLDEGGAPFGSLGSNSSTIDLVNLGDDGFGILLEGGDSGDIAVSVNPSGNESDECAGQLTVTDPAADGFVTAGTWAVVDVCLGDRDRFDPVAQTSVDAVGYYFALAEGDGVWAYDNGDGTFGVAYVASSWFEGLDDPAGTKLDFAAGFEMRGTVTGQPGTSADGQSRELYLSVSEEFVRSC